MKKVLVSVLFAFVGAAVLASTNQSNTPDGCEMGNGGHDPVCVPTVDTSK